MCPQCREHNSVTVAKLIHCSNFSFCASGTIYARRALLVPSASCYEFTFRAAHSSDTHAGREWHSITTAAKRGTTVTAHSCRARSTAFWQRSIWSGVRQTVFRSAVRTATGWPKLSRLGPDFSVRTWEIRQKKSHKIEKVTVLTCCIGIRVSSGLARRPVRHRPRQYVART
eukprot:SAG31_NODE_308_length_17951_cov_4.779240_6_plen_171_part_00